MGATRCTMQQQVPGCAMLDRRDQKACELGSFLTAPVPVINACHGC